MTTQASGARVAYRLQLPCFRPNIRFVEFSVLGPIQVVENGRQLTLGSKKHRALLALLVLRGGETVSRARLIDELWCGNPPPAAAASLRAYVSRLRSVVGAS